MSNKTLRELAQVLYGKSPNGIRAEESPFPIWGTGGKIGSALRPLFSGPIIILPRKGTLTNPSYCDIDCWVIDTAYAAIAHQDVDTKWLFYNLSLANLESLNEATGVPSISRDVLYKLKFYALNFDEQRKIAEILTTVDNLIEQTEAAIAKYQAIKQGMMHDLFTRGVDANGHLRPPREEAPELYKESELGWIPKEWAVKPVHGIGSVRLGRQRSPKHTSGKYTTPYLRVANVFDGWIDYSDILKMDFTPEEKSTYNVLPKDIFLNEGQSLELVGRSAIYNGKPDRYCFQNTLIRFRSFPENDHKFCWLVFKNWLDTELFMTIARQTTSVAHLGADRFSKLPFARPSHDEQVRISLRLDTVESKTQKIKQTRDKLQVLKSGLMQDLLSGRVRVPTDATTLQEPPHAS